MSLKGHHFVVRLSPREYAVIAALIIHNDAISKPLYMDLEVKQAFVNYRINEGVVSGGNDVSA